MPSTPKILLQAFAPPPCLSVEASQQTVDNLLPQIFGPGQGRRGQAQNYSNDIKQARRNGNVAAEFAAVEALINFTLSNYYAGNLIGGQGAATQERVLTLFYALYCASSISPIPDLTGIFGAENSVLIRNGTPTTIVNTALEDGGVQVEQGDVPATQDGQPFFGTFVSVFRTDDPLPTSLDWYGVDGFKQGAFEFVANPPVTFTEPVLTGVCIKFDNDYVSAPDLRLAHQVEPGFVPVVPGNYVVTTDGGTIEVAAPLSAAPLGLECTPLQSASMVDRVMQRLADVFLPGKLLAVEEEGGGEAGQVINFSPFAAVDTKLSATGSGPSSPQYIPLGSSSISAPVSVTVRTRHPEGLAISGISVAFGPNIAPAAASTDATGTASSSWTIVAGTNDATGTPSLGSLVFVGSPVAFSVEAIQINPVSVSVEPAPPGGTVGVGYGPFGFSATGGVGSFAWSVVGGSLPAGLGLTDSGVLTGTPTTVGSFTFTVRATSGPAGLEASGEAEFTVSIGYPPVNIITTSLPAGTRGVAYSASLSATGGDGSYSWSLVSGSLPNGLGLAGNTISGTPTASAVTATFTVQATSAGHADTEVLTLTVVSPTAIGLSFDVAPSKSRCYAVNVAMSPGIRVRVADQAGNLLSGVTVSVVAVTNNGAKVEVSPSSAVSVGGVASFGGPTINKTGGYALVVSTGAPWPVATITSGKFNISPAC